MEVNLNKLYKCPHIDYKFFCKECLSFLCDKCKLIHIHKDLINDAFFYSFAKFEIEMTKAKIEKFQVFKTFNNMIGFDQLKLRLITFYNETVNVENEMNFVLDSSKFNIEGILFNLKSILREEANLKTNDKESKNSLLEIMKRFTVYNEPFKKLNAVYEKFIKSFDNFVPLLNDLKKYQKIKEENCEKIIIENNSNLFDKIVKEKLEQFEKISDDNYDLEEKIKLLSEQNDKLVEMNQRLLEKMCQSNNENKENKENIENIENKETNENYNTAELLPPKKDLYNIYTPDNDKLFSFFKQKLIETCINTKDILEIDKFDMKKFIKMSYESIVTQINLKDFNLFQSHLQFPDFSLFLNNKQIFDLISNSEIVSQTASKFKSILLQEITLLLFENKAKIYSEFQSCFFDNYFLSSPRIKHQKILDLKSSGITDFDIKRVTDVINASKVFEVYLQNNSITDAGVYNLFSHLSSNKLKNIYINNNSLTEKSLKHFRNALKDKASLFENMKIISFENNSKVNEAKGKELVKEIRKNIKFTIYL